LKPPTDCPELVHRAGLKSPQRGHFGRLPNSGFRRNVNRPRDTAARKSGETRGSRRTGPALGSRVTGDLRIVTDPGPDQGFEAGFRLIPRGTGSGSEDGAGQTCGTRPDQSRGIQPTVTGVRSADAQARVQNSMAKSNPDLARARNATVRPGVPRPRSIPAPYSSPIGGGGPRSGGGGSTAPTALPSLRLQ